MPALKVEMPIEGGRGRPVELLEGQPIETKSPPWYKKRRQRPVDQEQINVVRTESLQRAIEGSARIIGTMSILLSFAGDEDFAAIQPGRWTAPHFGFVAVHLRGGSMCR